MSRVGEVSRYGITIIGDVDDGSDAPWCDSPTCYMHRGGSEHHAEGCPLYGTTAQAVHRFADLFEPIYWDTRAAAEKTWRGRLTLARMDLRSALADHWRYLRWQLRRPR